MKVSGFTLVRNGTRYDYPYFESLRSMLPLVDELVINVGIGDDDTLERIKEFADKEGQGKVSWFESRWPLDDPEKKKNGIILSEQTNLALDRCTGDWCVYLQADEVFHEADLPLIRQAMETHAKRVEVDGLLFDYVHFYGSFDVIRLGRGAYRREVRVIKRASDARSVGDAQSFRRSDGAKLSVVHCGARVFHYGWVRPPEKMREKTFFMDQLYHGTPKAADAQAGRPHTGENYRYKKIWGLTRFKATHPAVMRERIQTKNWTWDLANSPMEWSSKDAKKVVLDTIERLTGYRLFEYRSYRLLKNVATAESSLSVPSSSAVQASLILATHEMPRQLAMVLAALERQSTRSFEILICEDGKDPVTAAVVRNFQNRCPIPTKHLSQEHQGFRKCRILNEALRQAKGDTLIFLDGDCVPHRHFIEDHLSLQEEGTYLAGRRVELGPKISRKLTPAMVKNGFFDFPRPVLIWSVMQGDSQHLQRTIRVTPFCMRKVLKMARVDDLKGCNYSVSRKAMEAINGFDEDYEGYGREDTDVEIRLQNLGLRIKSLKGMALQFHVWHPRREFTPANDGRLEELKKSGRVRCEHGWK